MFFFRKYRKNKREKTTERSGYLPYYDTSKTHEDDVEIAVNVILTSSDPSARGDAQYFIQDHAQLSDDDYHRLMLGLIDRIETQNQHQDTDDAILLSNLLYGRPGIRPVSSEVYLKVTAKLCASNHPTCLHFCREISKGK